MSKLKLLFSTSVIASSMILASSTFALSAKVDDKKTETVAEKKVDSKKESAATTKYDISKGFSAVAEKAIPSVVNVSTTQVIEGRDKNIPQLPPGSPFEDLFKDFLDQMDKPKRVQSLGSGFIVKVEPKGDDAYLYVVTNFHVVNEAKKISIVLHDGTELDATIQAVDERTDLAMLKIKMRKKEHQG